MWTTGEEATVPSRVEGLVLHGPVRRDRSNHISTLRSRVFLGDGPARSGTFQNRAKQEELWRRVRLAASHAWLGSTSRTVSHPLSLQQAVICLQTP